MNKFVIGIAFFQQHKEKLLSSLSTDNQNIYSGINVLGDISLPFFEKLEPNIASSKTKVVSFVPSKELPNKNVLELDQSKFDSFILILNCSFLDIQETGKIIRRFQKEIAINTLPCYSFVLLCEDILINEYAILLDDCLFITPTEWTKDEIEKMKRNTKKMCLEANPMPHIKIYRKLIYIINKIFKKNS